MGQLCGGLCVRAAVLCGVAVAGSVRVVSASAGVCSSQYRTGANLRNPTV